MAFFRVEEKNKICALIMMLFRIVHKRKFLIFNWFLKRYINFQSNHTNSSEFKKMSNMMLWVCAKLNLLDTRRTIFGYCAGPIYGWTLPMHTIREYPGMLLKRLYLLFPLAKLKIARIPLPSPSRTLLTNSPARRQQPSMGAIVIRPTMVQLPLHPRHDFSINHF